MKFSVLENGFDFVLESIRNIQTATQETDANSKQRLLKYALLHLSSGMELIFKYRLKQEHWTYVFQKMDTADKNKLKSGDFISVDNQTIIDRLNRFCDIGFDMNDAIQLKSLKEKRNRLEHFEFNDQAVSVESTVYKCITILLKTIEANYVFDEFNPNEKELFKLIHSELFELGKHYNELKSLTQEELRQKKLESCVIGCPNCYEVFLLPDETSATCQFCGYFASGEEVASDYIRNVIGIDDYKTIKDGGEFPQYECPECGVDSLVFDNAATLTVICFSCGYKEDISKFNFCSSCNALFYKTADDIGICPDCIEYKLSKDC